MNLKTILALFKIILMGACHFVYCVCGQLSVMVGYLASSSVYRGDRIVPQLCLLFGWGLR